MKIVHIKEWRYQKEKHVCNRNHHLTLNIISLFFIFKDKMILSFRSSCNLLNSCFWKKLSNFTNFESEAVLISQYVNQYSYITSCISTLFLLLHLIYTVCISIYLAAYTFLIIRLYFMFLHCTQTIMYRVGRN